MTPYNFTSKRFLASALLTTGLLGSTPLISEDAVLFESSLITQEKTLHTIESQLCNQQFQCSKTGIVVHFLPNSKAFFIHPELSNTLRADYTVHFNRDIAMNVYENPSKYFDVMMQNVKIHPEGFVASVNREKRYFQKV